MAPRVLWMCLSVLKSIPVLFISSVIVWSYYAYVFQMCLFSVSSIAEKVIYIVIYHPLLVMMMWSYWKTIFTPVMSPPKEFYLPGSVLEQLQQDVNQINRRAILMQFGKTLPIQCRTLTGEMRYCDKCKAIKPDRAHHCSVCGRCVLKMDHHCPWVNNCVGFSNYKFFVLFIGYALVYCIYVVLSSLKYFIQFWSVKDSSSHMGNLHIVFLFFAAVMFAISLLSLFGYHCFLVARNRTTLESVQVPVFTTGPEKDGFDLGFRKNFICLFGSDRRFWFLPTATSFGNGLTYPNRNDDESKDLLLGRHQQWSEEGEGEDFV